MILKSSSDLSYLYLQATSNDYVFHIYFIIKNPNNIPNNFTLKISPTMIITEDNRLFMFINDNLARPSIVITCFKNFLT